MTGRRAERRRGGATLLPVLCFLLPGVLGAQDARPPSRLSLIPAGIMGWGMCDATTREAACLARLDRLTSSCPDSVTWIVAFGGPGAGSRVEWRRCRAEPVAGTDTTTDGMGPGERHVLLVRSGPATTDPVVLAWDNVEEPGLSFLDRIGPVDPDGDGAQELAIWAGLSGTGAIRAWCILGRDASGFHCWPWPDVTALVQQRLGAGEMTWKGLLAAEDPMVALRPGGRLTLRTGIYRQGDGNCCPSGGEIRLRFTPGRGRMELEDVTRTR